jgi:bifunctional ADP-heptose synthase (sugar kinase/adenylyltransferase)
MSEPLTGAIVDMILGRIPGLTIGILGDLFLDRYLDLDGALTEPSLETGLPAYQVTRVRSSPGAAGTVLNNLVALGVGHVRLLAVIGDDGEGYELRQALGRLAAVDLTDMVVAPDRRTPTYTKPMLHEAGRPPRELNRVDIKNRRRLTRDLENKVLRILDERFPRADAWVVLDQVSEVDCGVVTEAVRDQLADLGAREPRRPVLADSRERIGLFRSVMLKPNRRECLHAAGLNDDGGDIADAVRRLARRVGRPVFCTTGERGILVADPALPDVSLRSVPAYSVSGPVDIVGAGDSTSAGIACALAAVTRPRNS